jgi:hypothetical protein
VDWIVRHVTPLAHILHDLRAILGDAPLFLREWHPFVAHSARLR